MHHGFEKKKKGRKRERTNLGKDVFIDQMSPAFLRRRADALTVLDEAGILTNPKPTRYQPPPSPTPEETQLFPKKNSQ